MSDPITILHLADIHIGMENYGQLDSRVGLNSRVVDFCQRLDEAIDYALEHDVELVIFAGDAYKTRNPNATYQREFARRIKRLSEAGIPILLLIGNHDQPSASRRASSVDIFGTLEVDHVTVARSEKIYTLTTKHGRQLQIATVPYPSRSRLLTHQDYKNLDLSEIDANLRQILTENVRALAQQLDPALPAVLAAHISVAEAQQGSEQHVMVGQDVILLKNVVADPAFDYVALGHIHKHQDLNEGHQPPVVYAGSLERIDFGEEKERKGFVVAHVAKGNTRFEFVPVHARPFVTIRVDANVADPTARIIHEIDRHDVTDAVVRVLIDATEEVEPLIDERAIREALSEANYISAIRKHIKRPHRQRLGAESPEELAPAQALRKYFEALGTDPEHVDTLMTYAANILDK